MSAPVEGGWNPLIPHSPLVTPHAESVWRALAFYRHWWTLQASARRQSLTTAHRRVRRCLTETSPHPAKRHLNTSQSKCLERVTSKGMLFHCPQVVEKIVALPQCSFTHLQLFNYIRSLLLLLGLIVLSRYTARRPLRHQAFADNYRKISQKNEAFSLVKCFRRCRMGRWSFLVLVRRKSTHFWQRYARIYIFVPADLDLWRLDLIFAPLVTLVQRWFHQIRSFCGFPVVLFRENRRHWTDGRSAALNAVPREDRIITTIEYV